VGTVFRIKRFAVVFVGAFLVICAAQALKGHGLPHAVTEGAIWCLVTAAVFTAARWHQSRQGRRCEICEDTPEPQSRHSGATRDGLGGKASWRVPAPIPLG